jgi:hypothetical protein
MPDIEPSWGTGDPLHLRRNSATSLGELDHVHVLHSNFCRGDGFINLILVRIRFVWANWQPRMWVRYKHTWIMRGTSWMRRLHGEKSYYGSFFILKVKESPSILRLIYPLSFPLSYYYRLLRPPYIYALPSPIHRSTTRTIPQPTWTKSASKQILCNSKKSSLPTVSF